MAPSAAAAAAASGIPHHDHHHHHHHQSASWSEPPEDHVEGKPLPRDGILKKGALEQKIVSSNVFWDARKALLTETELFLAKTNTPEVECDSILLHEVMRMFLEGDDDHGLPELVVRTDPNGANFGRTYTWRSKVPEEVRDWHDLLSKHVELATKSHMRKVKEEGLTAGEIMLFEARENVKDALSTHAYKTFGSIIIVLSFLSDILEAEALPETGTQLHETFASLDLLFTSFFMLELFVNTFAHGFELFKETWQCIDAGIVLFSALAVFLAVGSTKIKMIRCDIVRDMLWGALAHEQTVITRLPVHARS